MHAGAVAMAILGPLGLLLPPRRVSVQNAILGGGAYWGFNQLAHDYTGKSLMVRSNERLSAILGWPDRLPERAERNRALMAQERERRQSALPDEERRAMEAKQLQQPGRGVLGRLWMGSEKDGWKDERLRKEKEALESGKGYADLIMEQIREVWTQTGEKDRKDGQGTAEEGRSRRDNEDQSSKGKERR